MAYLDESQVDIICEGFTNLLYDDADPREIGDLIADCLLQEEDTDQESLLDFVKGIVEGMQERLSEAGEPNALAMTEEADPWSYGKYDSKFKEESKADFNLFKPPESFNVQSFLQGEQGTPLAEEEEAGNRNSSVDPWNFGRLDPSFKQEYPENELPPDSSFGDGD